jgi:CheY-like chemotaxis protein
MKNAPSILLIEDDEDDLFLARRILKKGGIADVRHAGDGRQALDYLEGRGAFADRAAHPLPDVMLVDLKIPLVNGHQVVEWLATQPQLKGIRAYVLSSSGEERDRTRARAAGAAGYFVKPLNSADIALLLATTAQDEASTPPNKT